MKKMITLLSLLVVAKLNAQKLDSIYFNLYTDSLKRGTHNYINVEGKYRNGRILPVDSTEVVFTTSSGSLSGNSVWIAANASFAPISFTATIKGKPASKITIVIPIKQKNDDESLPNEADLLKQKKQ
jgi:hypothetical protein